VNGLVSYLLSEFEWWRIHFPTPVALGLVALLGYYVGVRGRRSRMADEQAARRELKRAETVARDLERIAEALRRGLASHHASVLKFKERVSTLSTNDQNIGWENLCREAEDMLKPTMKLATQLATAYDEIRQQSNNLMTFTDVRTDPLTGVCNRRALDDQLTNFFAMLHRYDSTFSLAIVDIDNFKQINDEQGHLYGDGVLRSVAKVLADCARDTDLVARFGGEEFVILMPETGLEDGVKFAERLRKELAKNLPLTASTGVAMAVDGDNPQTLLARADAALYSAKAGGRNKVYCHTGLEILSFEQLEDQLSSGETTRAPRPLPELPAVTMTPTPVTN
jgi:diguanylate cyclase